MNRLDDTSPTAADGLNKVSILRHIREIKTAVNAVIDKVNEIDRILLGIGDKRGKK